MNLHFRFINQKVAKEAAERYDGTVEGMNVSFEADDPVDLADRICRDFPLEWRDFDH